MRDDQPATTLARERPEDWSWSSFREYAFGEVGVVEIESQRTARKREQAGIFLTLKKREPAKSPAQAEVGQGFLETVKRDSYGTNFHRSL
ncbi:MAG: hypothetical protein WBX38_09175 [Candidatus Sulfotelmatobacter sp.]